LLKNYYPQALQLAGDLDSPMACDFLLHWPTLARLQQAGPARLQKFYLKHHCPSRERIQERLQLCRQAQPLLSDPALIESMQRMLIALVRQLQALLTSIQEFDQQIKVLYAAHPEHDLFDSFPGAGAALGPRLLSAFGTDRGKFQKAQQIRNFSGIAPITKKSGKTRLVQARLAYPRFLRQTFHEFATHSLSHSLWARQLYQRLRSVGVSHHAAIRVVAYKWIAILFACWKNRTLYDEQYYLLAKHKRSQPLPRPLEEKTVQKM
jgi:hypothetical protein